MVDLRATDIRTFVPAADFETSKAFYTALGCTIPWSDEQLALVEMGNRCFYLQRYHVKEWAENCMLHVTVADARSCHEQIAGMLATGRFPTARVAAPKEEPYGALVTHVWDPAGVLLHLAQWLPQA